MTRDQKTVAFGASSGIAVMLAALVALSNLLPGMATDAPAGERLGYAVQWMAVAALPLFLAIASVGNGRFKSEAIDPTLGKESREMIINGRVADNTLQQYVLFFAASLALAAAATGGEMGTISAASIIFVIARFAFWIGYRIHPLYRAFGMAATSYLCLALFAYTAWLAWRP